MISQNMTSCQNAHLGHGISIPNQSNRPPNSRFELTDNKVPKRGQILSKRFLTYYSLKTIQLKLTTVNR